MINIGDPDGPPRLVRPILRLPWPFAADMSAFQAVVPFLKPRLPLESRYVGPYAAEPACLTLVYRNLSPVLYRLRLRSPRKPPGPRSRHHPHRRGVQEHAAPVIGVPLRRYRGVATGVLYPFVLLRSIIFNRGSPHPPHSTSRRQDATLHHSMSLLLLDLYHLLCSFSYEITRTWGSFLRGRRTLYHGSRDSSRFFWSLSLFGHWRSTGVLGLFSWQRVPRHFTVLHLGIITPPWTLLAPLYGCHSVWCWAGNGGHPRGGTQGMGCALNFLHLTEVLITLPWTICNGGRVITD